MEALAVPEPLVGVLSLVVVDKKAGENARWLAITTSFPVGTCSVPKNTEDDVGLGGAELPADAVHAHRRAVHREPRLDLRAMRVPRHHAHLGRRPDAPTLAPTLSGATVIAALGGSGGGGSSRSTDEAEELVVGPVPRARRGAAARRAERAIKVEEDDVGPKLARGRRGRRSTPADDKRARARGTNPFDELSEVAAEPKPAAPAPCG